MNDLARIAPNRRRTPGIHPSSGLGTRMLRGAFLFVGLVFFSAILPSAASPQGGFDSSLMAKQAKRAYDQGRFEEAGRLYQLMASSGFDGAEIRYDLGNSYLKAGEIPRAILEYRRALKMDAGLKRASHNLALARNLLPARAASWQPPPWESFLQDLPVSLMMWVLVVLALAANGLFWLYLFAGPGRTRRFLMGGVVALLISGAVLGAGIYYSLRVLTLHQPAVVLHQARVYARPDGQGEILATLPPGSEVIQVAQAGGWRLLLWGEGRGWTRAPNVEVP